MSKQPEKPWGAWLFKLFAFLRHPKGSLLCGNATNVKHFDLLLFRPIHYSESKNVGNSTNVIVFAHKENTFSNTFV